MGNTGADMVPEIKVLIVDDHAVVRDSLALALDHEPDIEVAATAPGPDEALAAVRAAELDVAVVDYTLDGADGVTLAAQLREVRPELKVLMLTATDDDHVLLAALEAGCAGFLTKGQPLEDVVSAVRTAATGESVVAAALLARLLPQLQKRNQQRASLGDLTEREREVLLMMAGGSTNQVIAEELYLSLHTVRNHVQNILRKLDAHSKLEAVAIAVQQGLIPATRR